MICRQGLVIPFLCLELYSDLSLLCALYSFDDVHCAL